MAPLPRCARPDPKGPSSGPPQYPPSSSFLILISLLHFLPCPYRPRSLTAQVASWSPFYTASAPTLTWVLRPSTPHNRGTSQTADQLQPLVMITIPYACISYVSVSLPLCLLSHASVNLFDYPFPSLPRLTPLLPRPVVRYIPSVPVHGPPSPADSPHQQGRILPEEVVH